MELVTVMLLVGIIAAIGMPSLKYVTTSNRIATEINGLLGDMQFARSQAIKLGLAVSVCPSTDQSSCSGGTDWTVGWIVFVDATGTPGTRDTGDTILRTQKAFTATDTFAPSDTTFRYISFNRVGYGSTGMTTNIALQLHSTPTNNQWTRCLELSPIGSVMTEKYGQSTSCT